MRLGICNEMFGDTPFDEVCRVAAEVGYEGIELAPFVFCEQVGDLTADDRASLRATAARHGLSIIGLHWLLIKPPGLHMTTPDDALRARTRDFFIELVHCCADLGGELLVCGSPKQRQVLDSREAAWERLVEVFQPVARAAGERGVTFCIEPLGPPENDFITCAAEGRAMVAAVDHPNFQLILDVKALCSGEPGDLPTAIRDSAAQLRHFHANDANLLGPGMGETDHGPIAAALRQIGYQHWVSVEVFKFELGGPELARQSFAGLQRWYA
ncbi:MAG: sugar phosphate isomerase/epimerase [Fimbriimonadaceae bacterium]|nr:sugar phosphate isomerase/epimerase [Fimbriimonadaceae bacterium]